MRLMKYILISFTSIFPQNELLVTTNKSIKHLDFLVTQLDDALSATRLPDGRIKVWIHVADPTCLVKPHSIIDR
jgi:exoribonuclease II